LEILELIGRGSMGFVYKARQTRLDRLVALKLLPEARARDPHFTERFNREGRVLAKLNHQNIVSIFDFGKAEDFYFLVMEYVDGVNMRQAMQAGRFSPSEALSIVPKICEALQYAHDQGVLHRDIKPENILLDSKGRVKIADFGIAKLVGEDPASVTLTGTGSALGTPHYMAPEQLEKPAQVDHRADIYSLGVVFYEMLTGELPIGRFAPPSRKTPLDERVDQIVLRALEKERELRQQSANEVKTEVEGVSATSPPPALASRAPASPESPPVAIPPSYQRVLVLPLVFLVFLMFAQLIPGITGTGRSLAHTLRIGVLPAILTGTAIIGIALLSIWIWRKRELLFTPLGLSPDLTVVRSDSGIFACSGWLRLTLVAGVGCLYTLVLLELMAYVFMLAQSIPYGNIRQTAGMIVELLVTLTTFLLPMLMVGRELRRTDLIPPAPAPPWMLRLAFPLLALGILSGLGWILQEMHPERVDIVAVEMNLSSRGYLFMWLTVIALLTRSRIWRAIAIPVSAWFLLTGIISQGFYFHDVISAFPGSVIQRLPEGLTAQYLGKSAAIFLVGLLMLTSFAVSAAGLAALLLPRARAAFGLAPHPRGSGHLIRWLSLSTAVAALFIIERIALVYWSDTSRPAIAPPVAPSQPVSSDAATQKQEIEINLARLQLEEVEKKINVGLLPPLGPEALAARRDVALAEARLKGDDLAEARIRHEYAAQFTTLMKKLREVGKATPEELAQAIQEEDNAKTALGALEKKR